jgi:2-oxoisovalerate dehydrogenase E1 component
MGKRSGVCGGRGGSQHLCWKGFFSNGVQGGIMPVAAGLALAQKLTTSGGITVVFIGDGTLGEGVVYETLNVASKWDLPLLVVLENNLYAQSTHQRQTLAGDICMRAEAFGITARHGNTWEPENLLTEAGRCVAAVRTEGRPVFLRIDTFRLMAHSKGDDDRAAEEVQAYWAKDPLTRFCRENREAADRMLAAAEERVAIAVESAEQAPFAETSDGGGASQAAWRPVSWQATKIARPERGVTLIREAFHRALERDQRVVLIGEDIESPYGGAFKATKGLSDVFSGRVRNTPISEALIVGLGNGLALAGLRPVCEIMFGDFLTLAADQWLNHAAKFRYMYNEQVQAPLILRTPMGGRRGYGPTHSQSIEKHFLGVPGTRVFALNHRSDPGEFYDQLFAQIEAPSLVIENKLLYAHRVSDELSPGFVLEHTDEPFPTTRLRPEATPDITIVCYGGMLKEVEEAVMPAFDEHEVVCEVICPAQLFPLNARPIVDSAARSRRLLVVEEGAGFAGFGAEVIVQVQQRLRGVPIQVGRVACADHPIPSCAPLERKTLPGADSILQAVLEMTAHG